MRYMLLPAWGRRQALIIMKAHLAIDLKAASDHRAAVVGIAVHGDIGVRCIDITHECRTPVDLNLFVVGFSVDDEVGRKAREIHHPLPVQLGVFGS